MALSLETNQLVDIEVPLPTTWTLRLTCSVANLPSGATVEAVFRIWFAMGSTYEELVAKVTVVPVTVRASTVLAQGTTVVSVPAETLKVSAVVGVTFETPPGPISLPVVLTAFAAPVFSAPFEHAYVPHA